MIPKYDYIHYAMLALFGSMGVSLRFLLTLWIPKYSGVNIPILAVNVLGSFLLGYFYVHLHLQGKSSWYVWAAVGLCGGLTTFSSFTLDLVLLLQQHSFGTAALYGALSVGISLLAVWVGMHI